MPRVKKPIVQPIDTSNITVDDVTDDSFPKGVPKDEDGGVATEGTISRANARKIGAVTVGAARYNNESMKIVARKRAGEKDIPWNEPNAALLFDLVADAHPSTGLYAHVAMIEPDHFDYAPIKVSTIKCGADFHNYVLRNIHKCRPRARYEVVFKEASKQVRGKGWLELPDTTDDMSLKGPDMNQFGNNGHAIPPAFQQPQGPLVVNGMMYNPQYGWIPVPPAAAAATAASAPVAGPVLQQQQQPQYQPPQPQQAAGSDQILSALSAIYQKQDQLDRALTESRQDTARAFGIAEEYKRRLDQQPTYPPVFQQLQPQIQPQTTQQQAPPPPGPQIVNPPSRQMPQMAHLGYDQNGQPVFGYAQPVVQQQNVAPAAPQYQPQQQVQQNGMMGAIGSIIEQSNNLDLLLKALAPKYRAAQGHQPDDDETEAATTPTGQPDKLVQKLGFNDDSPVIIKKENGDIDVVGSLLGNMGQLPKIFHGVAEGITKINQANAQMQHQRPIRTHAIVEQQQQFQDLAEEQPQHQSLVPSLNGLPQF